MSPVPRASDASRLGNGSALTTTMWGDLPFRLRIRFKPPVRAFCERSLRSVHPKPADFSRGHDLSNPITYSSCIRSSICDCLVFPQRAGIMRLSRSRRRTPIPARLKPVFSPIAASPLCVSTSTPRRMDVPTTTMAAFPCFSTRCISRITAPISPKYRRSTAAFLLSTCPSTASVDSHCSGNDA